VFLSQHKGLIAAGKGARRLLGEEAVAAALNDVMTQVNKLCSKHPRNLDTEARRGLVRRLKAMRKIHRKSPEAEAVYLYQFDLRGGEEVMIAFVRSVHALYQRVNGLQTEPPANMLRAAAGPEPAGLLRLRVNLEIRGNCCGGDVSEHSKRKGSF
jgi:hypothetical protein